jgi:hypothetical protein
MNKLLILALKSCRKVYGRFFNDKRNYIPDGEQNPDKVSQIIYDALMNDKPCMVARFGANELNALINYQSINSNYRSICRYIKSEQFDWWWNEGIIKCLHENAGFFPARKDKIEQFCELMIQDIPKVDILGSWLQNELQFQKELNAASKVRLMYLDPYWTTQPWTRALKGKKILVVHPFTETIKSQYPKRELLFKNKDVLPEFQSLSLVKAVQSLGNGNDQFNDWFEALEFMKAEIDTCDYDICLIGCGAYGFPLAAHVKRMGKKAFHLGGSLQLLFGIRGKRWEVNDPHYEPGNVFIDYYSLPNEHWVRPAEEEKPSNHSKVEDSCYW